MKHRIVTRLRCDYRVQELSMIFWTARSNGWSDDGGCCTMMEHSWICQPAPTDSRRCIDNIEGTLLPSCSVDRADQAHLSFVPERCRALVESQSFFLVVAVLGFATEHPPRFPPSSGCRLYLQ